MRKEIAVFLGPSLSVHEASSLLDGEYLPPAKQGDILSYAVQFRPKTIVLIDGYFHSRLSPWHKEILYALHLGINLVGASSMGALRAAETSSFGMVGIGKIFELYQSGEVQDDDEVALIHAPAEENYLPLSIPLINLRFTFKKLKEERKLPEPLCEAFFSLFRELFYPDRTYEKMEAKAKEKGFSPSLIQEVASALQSNYVDQKREDARAALEALKTLPKKAAPHFPHSVLFDVLYHFERRHFYSGGSLSNRQICSFVSLHHPKFPELLFQAMNQQLASMLSRVLQIEASEKEVEEERERFLFRLKILSREELASWLESNHLTREEFDSLLLDRAKVRKLQNSLPSGQIQWRKIKSLLDELKWRGEYADWAAKAAAAEDFVRQAAPEFDPSRQGEIDGAFWIEAQLSESAWSPDVPFEKWAEEAGFQSSSELTGEMIRSKIARDYLKNLF